MNASLSQVGETGYAVGIDHIDELVSDSVKNLKKDATIGGLLDSGRIKMVVGDGRLGYPAHGPYNAIHVGAAAPEIPQAVGVGEGLKPKIIPFAYSRMSFLSLQVFVVDICNITISTDLSLDEFVKPNVKCKNHLWVVQISRHGHTILLSVSLHSPLNGLIDKVFTMSRVTQLSIIILDW